MIFSSKLTRVRRLLAQFARRGHRLGDGAERRIQRPQHAFSRLSRRDLAGRAAQEANAHARLEAIDCVAERRLRGVELRRGAGEAALFRHGRERIEIDQLLAPH